MSEEFRAALARTEDRLADRQDKLIDRVEEGVGKIFAKIDLRMDASDKTLEIEIGEVKVALGELRDGAAEQRKRLDALEAHHEDNMRGAAEGAAKGAGEAAGAVATAAAAIVSDQVVAQARVLAATQKKPIIGSIAGKVVAGSAVVMAALAVLGAIPAVIKYAALILTFLAGLAK